MPLYRIGDVSPRLGFGAWAAPSADLIGDIRLGARASVWFGAILRGDNTPLILGEETNFQDGAIGHSDPGFPLTVGARVTIGHQAILHGCTIADDCLIGRGARILNGALIESECIVGAGALITEGKHFEAGSLIVGAPARVVRQVTEGERRLLRLSAAHYAEKAQRFASQL
ncbi:MAG: gamma carbonic anhydrase family protein, partial [Sphingomicrobium sp.]